MKMRILFLSLLCISSSVAFVSPTSSFRKTVLFYGSKDEDSNDLRRQQRLEREQALRKRFAWGNELKSLRADLVHLRENLKWAEATQDQSRINDLSEAIAKGENRDPETVYSNTLKAIAELEKTPHVPQKETILERWSKVAADARECLPRFHLDGLWIGNFGDQGYNMINVTYSDDTLVATKVTGHKNVANGAISFKVDMSPAKSLPAIELSADSASKWNMNEFQRYIGQGQISKEGKVDASFVEGQLILFEKHFSFVWIPTRHHAFFSRPSPEETLRMLRDKISHQDELENQRRHLEQCLDMDMTTSIARSMSGEQEPLRRIRREEELKEIEKNNSLAPLFGFQDVFSVQKWRNYIDEVLNDDWKWDTNNK